MLVIWRRQGWEQEVLLALALGLPFRVVCQSRPENN